MKKIFKNSNNELRSGWKIAGVIGVLQVLYFIWLGVVPVIIGTFMAAHKYGKIFSIDGVGIQVDYFLNKDLYGLLIHNAIGFICVLIAVFMFLKEEKKSFKSIGLTSIKKGYKDLVIGLLFGIASISFVFFMLLGTKNITVTNPSKPYFSSYAVIGLIIYVFVGIGEELLSRGYCITALNQMKKPWLSVVISACIFSSLHFFNPNVKPLGLINIILVGVLFGYMYVKSGNLWMPIGYHITWNYFQGSVYGLNVSGFDVEGIFHSYVLKNNILTGGAFGPEAGILTTIVIIIGFLIVWKLPLSFNKKGNL